MAAAQATGIRLVFGANVDGRADAPPNSRKHRPGGQTHEELMRAFRDNGCVAPHSLHAASADMIRAAAEFGPRHDTSAARSVAEAS